MTTFVIKIDDGDPDRVRVFRENAMQSSLETEAAKLRRARSTGLKAEVVSLRNEKKLLEQMFCEAADLVQQRVQRDGLGLGGEDVFRLLCGEYDRLRQTLELVTGHFESRAGMTFSGADVARLIRGLGR